MLTFSYTYVITTGKIDDILAASYRELYENKNKKRESSASVQKSLEDSIEVHNTSTASALDAKRRKTAPVSRSTRNSECASTLTTYTTNNTVASVDGGGNGRIKNNLQLKVHDGSNALVERKLTMAIANMIHSFGLPLSLASKIKFWRVMNLACNVPSNYRPPGRNQVVTKLLDINYDIYMEKLVKALQRH
jgi:hypothetical protein